MSLPRRIKIIDPSSSLNNTIMIYDMEGNYYYKPYTVWDLVGTFACEMVLRHNGHWTYFYNKEELTDLHKIDDDPNPYGQWTRGVTVI